MLSIGQFARVCHVSIKTLHHYDKIGLLKPVHIDEETGYRFYSNAQISTMLLIQRYKRYGFSLTEIKYLLAISDERVLLSELEQKKLELENQKNDMETILSEMNNHLINFERTGNIMAYQNSYKVNVKNVGEMAVVSSRQVMSVEEFGKYYGQIFEKIGKDRLTPTGKVMAIYHDEDFNPEHSNIELAVEIKEKDMATQIIPPALCAMTTHIGAYSNLSDAYGALAKFIEDNGYEIIGCPYDVYVKDMKDNLPVDKWETEVYFPVKKK